MESDVHARRSMEKWIAGSVLCNSYLKKTDSKDSKSALLVSAKGEVRSTVISSLFANNPERIWNQMFARVEA